MRYIQRARALVGTLFEMKRQLDRLEKRIDDLQMAAGRIELDQHLPKTSLDFRDYDFKVYSEHGEDGLIQFLMSRVEIDRTVFVEFGVENYKESNTRFLLRNNNWSGLVLDARSSDVEEIIADPIFWRHNLKVAQSFITQDNINDLLRTNGVTGDIGLLSLDIDGNEYWIWKAIDSISPRIVVCEYNSTFGYDRKVVVPYDPAFDRMKAHYSGLWYGSSISALADLGGRKGYSLVGSNLAGHNAFFVRNDVINGLAVLSPHDAYRQAQFRESRRPGGELDFLQFHERLERIADMPLVDVARGDTISVRDLMNARY